MTNIVRFSLRTAALFALSSPALADAPAQSVTLTAENQHFEQGRGDIRSATLEYRIDLGDTALTAAPVIARRHLAGPDRSTAGLSASLWHDWTPGFSTRTAVAAAGHDGILPYLDLAQDFTVTVVKGTTVTAGARLARFEGRDVRFVSLGVRHYFKGGSVSYRLTRADPDRAPGFFSHLASLSLKDGKGRGKTQVWLSYGGDADARTPLDLAFSAHDYGMTLQRLQPLTGALALVPALGYESYDRPGGRIGAASVSLGLELTIR